MSAVGRAGAVALLLLLALATPGVAQRRDRAEAEAFLLFLESVAAQRTARVCERGIPGYRERFDDVFVRWSARHRSRVERGERVFHEAAAEKDRPYLDHAKMEQIERAIAELKEPPRDRSPIEATDGMRTVCEQVLGDLEGAHAR